MRQIKIGRIYKHFKGNLYQVIAIANDSESLNNDIKKIVVYKALYAEYTTWARPYESFISKQIKTNIQMLNKYIDLKNIRKSKWLE